MIVKEKNILLKLKNFVEKTSWKKTEKLRVSPTIENFQ